jgi:hypothetical protein
MVRPALVPASPGALFFASIGLNILLLLLYVIGNGLPYVFTRKPMEETEMAFAEHAESIAGDLTLEQSLGFSGRGQGGEGCTMCGVAPRLCVDIGYVKPGFVRANLQRGQSAQGDIIRRIK